MPSVRDAVVPTPRRSLLRGLVVAAAVAAGTAVSIGVPAVAAADETAGTTVVGRLLQAWPESAPQSVAGAVDGAGADGPVSWVQGADGQTTRISTDGVEGVTPGSTVQVTLGAPVRWAPTRRHSTGWVWPSRTSM